MRKDQIYSYFLENDYIQYGALIPIHILEEVFCHKREDGWEFLGKALSLKMALEENGYFSKLSEYGLQIAEASDNAFLFQKRLRSTEKRTTRWGTCLHNTETDDMTVDEKQHHYHSIEIANKMKRHFSSILADI